MQIEFPFVKDLPHQLPPDWQLQNAYNDGWDAADIELIDATADVPQNLHVRNSPLWNAWSDGYTDFCEASATEPI